MSKHVLTLVSLLFIAGCATTNKGMDGDAAASITASSKKGGDDDGKKNGDDDEKKYSDVITDEAVTDEGLFTVHKVEEKYYYEIPDSLFEKEMILVTRIARTADNIGYGGEKANTQVVRWQKKDDRVLLRVVSYDNVANEDDPIYSAVRNSNFEPIVMGFDIAAWNDDSTQVVIEVNPLFVSDVPSLGLQSGRRETYKVKKLDADRTFINSLRSYPLNVEVRNVLTYDAGSPPSNGTTGTISLEMNHSMILLPADPMMPRVCDRRVGFFAVRQTDYGRDAQKAEQRCYITRWRLEPSDPAAFARGELVEPVKPIVYYIDPATPEKWRPYLKQGVQDWSKAFEAAGFRNAIRAMDPPSPEEDPEFTPEDVRYSVIRYFSSDVQNAYGPHVHDPRTGEILESDIGWFHNVMNLLRNWYFVQTAAVNPNARGVQFQDEVMGELVRFVSAHEVGHTLGLPHNWGSSVAYPVDSLRSATFTQKMGTAPSIMDYARFNYIAQPGDQGVSFHPAIGPYDVWSVTWGYRPIPDAKTADEEKETLAGWVTERAGDPMYFYGRQSGSRIDPRSQNEDLGNSAMQAGAYGVANLKRIVPNLVEWTSENGKDYDDLGELYNQVIFQWNRYMGHAARNIGGVYENHKTYDQEGVVYDPVPGNDQKEAMAFLHEHAFATPDWMLDAGVLRRIEHAGAVDRIRRFQVGVLELVLDPQRIARLIEADAIGSSDAYPPQEMFDDIRTGVFSEVRSRQTIGPYRRNLQRGYLETMRSLMEEEVTPPSPQFASFVGFTPVDVSQSDIRAYVRGQLKTLRQEIQRALRSRLDGTTRLHLDDLVVRIDDILDPKS